MSVRRDFTHAMLGFGTMLRAEGMRVTTRALTDAVRALEVINLLDRSELYLALQALLVNRKEEKPAFERCFDTFFRFQAHGWQGLLTDLQPCLPEEVEAPKQGFPGAAPPQVEAALEEWGEGEATDAEPLELPGESDREILLEQDFSAFPAERLDEVARLTEQIAKRLARQPSRRRRPARRGAAIDFRRSIRANLMRDEIIALRRRARRRRKLRLVLLCDVSGSMDIYSRFLLQFLYAVQNVFRRVETFTFATRLTRVTELLRGPSYKGALQRLSGVRDWSGGTRIGESLRDFNENWGLFVDRRTIVLLLSDGWDTGQPDVLAQEMLTLKRRAGRVIWLNPLLGNPSYEPLTRGMAAALPLVDHFAAAHNLASLRALAGHLSLR